MMKQCKKQEYRFCVLLILLCVLCLSGCGKKENTPEMSGNSEEENSITAVEESVESAPEEDTEPFQEDTTQEDDLTHDGISVLVVQDADSFEYERVWYPDVDTFLQKYDFLGEEPFFEYYDQNGCLQMTCYYDEQKERGLGIRYFERDPGMFTTSGMYGFVWSGISRQEWNGLDVDYFSTTSVFGDDVSDCKDIENYQEHYEYDEDGKIIHFDAQGIITYLGDGDEASTLLWIDYVYREDGSLMYRAYVHHALVFSTACATVESYFDELGRLVYEDQYITHGSMDFYYIYEDEDDIPEYCLVLDLNLSDWYPVLIKYN